MSAAANAERRGVDHILTRAGILRHVEPAAAAALIEQLHPAEFAAGEMIFAEGDPGDRVFIIVAGKVKISLRGPSGRTNLRAIMGPTDVFGELAVFDAGPRTCTATAITDVRTMWLDRATLRAWMTERPTIAEQLLQVLSRRLRNTDDELVELVSSDVAARVARQLLLLGGRFGVPDGDALRVAHELSQDEMAQLVGADRTSVNRALRNFASRGWIVLEGKAVLIVDPRALARRAAVRGRAGAPSSRRRRPLRATA
ncbi:Crp/Fnr family transcriptional regulator [Mycobacterium saskatchewanense]|nr:Crp/Fnr family transcriptional regulator [Mycobacterium saskatchewanense]BBX64066.1 Crp/Fnr family transcriptional regulator [Mycobacterium saskatchewanense]